MEKLKQAQDHGYMAAASRLAGSTREETERLMVTTLLSSRQLAVEAALLVDVQAASRPTTAERVRRVWEKVMTDLFGCCGVAAACCDRLGKMETMEAAGAH